MEPISVSHPCANSNFRFPPSGTATSGRMTSSRSIRTAVSIPGTAMPGTSSPGCPPLLASPCRTASLAALLPREGLYRVRHGQASHRDGWHRRAVHRRARIEQRRTASMRPYGSRLVKAVSTAPGGGSISASRANGSLALAVRRAHGRAVPAGHTLAALYMPGTLTVLCWCPQARWSAVSLALRLLQRKQDAPPPSDPTHAPTHAHTRMPTTLCPSPYAYGAHFRSARATHITGLNSLLSTCVR